MEAEKLAKFVDAGFCNADLIEDLYERYWENPSHIDSSWQEFFSDPVFAKEDVKKSSLAPLNEADALKLYKLLQAYRTYGHFEADINPIDTIPPEPFPELSLSHIGFTSEDLNKNFPSLGLSREGEIPLKRIVENLRHTYCGKIGFEFMHADNLEMAAWIQNEAERRCGSSQLSIEEKKKILQHLNKSELFEVFLHTKYSGQKRFSLEGGETLIPMLGAIIETGAERGVEHLVLGMAHRGRLNVLSNIFNKSYSDIFSEFEESYIPNSFEGSGDVKYHKGFVSKISTSAGHEVSLTLPDNPSHLEAVYPVVEGIVRAKQIIIDNEKVQDKVLPLIIHGDAAMSGQGVIYETMQFYRLPGYNTGGTIHIVINNQIGFTTLPKDARSTHYCTDIAKAFGAPVLHVNAEYPEECIYAAKMAAVIRQRYHCDVVLDLNCYRKYGHNEGDEPAYTQPIAYELIRSKSGIREIYRDQLIQQGVLERKMANELEELFKSHLQQAQSGTQIFDMDKVDAKFEKIEAIRRVLPEELFNPVDTRVPAESLVSLTRQFCTVPKGFTIHKKLEKLLEARLQMVEGSTEDAKIDWGLGEHLALASLLAEGKHVRLSGQDSRRGTFSHRHAMWIDQKNASKYFPLSNLSKEQGRFDVFNSHLSEYGVLGFEFGYTLACSNSLVMWEAQFGDFSNGAQIVIDQFIATSEQKWGHASNLTMLLPHGYEGQGPEHSSARMERFLQLSGDANIQVVNPTTPAQLFHLLRRQVLQNFAKPLIVFTPKGLLRYPACVSSLKDLSEGSFQLMIDDPRSPKKASRLLLCNGRVFYDLIEARAKIKNSPAAIVRIEQLYPLHVEQLKQIIQKYPDIKEICWVQEEPSNMGAWDFIRPILQEIAPKLKMIYAGRSRSAAPATGSHILHKKQQQELIKVALGI